jgi:hypothetical protein
MLATQPLGGLEMNRIQAAFDRMKLQIADRIKQGLTTQEKVDSLYKTLDLDLEDYVVFQEAKSLAVASGKLNLEEGMTIFNALGNTPNHFNKQPIHIKSVLTSLLKELLQARVNA